MAEADPNRVSEPAAQGVDEEMIAISSSDSGDESDSSSSSSSCSSSSSDCSPFYRKYKCTWAFQKCAADSVR